MVFLVGPVGQEGLIQGTAPRGRRLTHTQLLGLGISFSLSLFARAQKGLPVVIEQRQWERERKRWQGCGTCHPIPPCKPWLEGGQGAGTAGEDP